MESKDLRSQVLRVLHALPCTLQIVGAIQTVYGAWSKALVHFGRVKLPFASFDYIVVGYESPSGETLMSTHKEQKSTPSCHTMVGPAEYVPVSYQSGEKQAGVPSIHISRRMEGNGQIDGGKRQKSDQGEFGLKMKGMISEIDK